MAFTNYHRAALSLTAVILLSGCETMSNRNCPAFSGHPDLDSWATYDIGDTLIYTSDKGRSENYTLRSIVGSEPYEDLDFGDTEDIRCENSVTYLFEAAGVDHYISQVYTVIDRVGVDLADQPLYMKIAAVATPDSTPDTAPSFRYLISDPAQTASNNNSTVETEVSFSATREIGQITYQDVFEMTKRDPGANTNSSPETSLIRIIFARNAGLVQFERSDEETFTLTQP